MASAVGLSYQEARQAGPGTFLKIAAAATIEPRGFITDVEAEVTDAIGAYDLYLPNPTEFPGHMIAVRCYKPSGTADITLKAKGSPVGWVNITLGTNTEHGVWLSTGRRWVLLGGDAA